MPRGKRGGRDPKYDWPSVDWTRTNAEIADTLGIRAHETIARNRKRLGMPTVYPRRDVAETRDQRDQAIDAIVRIGHTRHCACRLAWGDGECECKAALPSDDSPPDADPKLQALANAALHEQLQQAIVRAETAEGEMQAWRGEAMRSRERILEIGVPAAGMRAFIVRLMRTAWVHPELAGLGAALGVRPTRGRIRKALRKLAGA